MLYERGYGETGTLELLVWEGPIDHQAWRYSVDLRVQDRPGLSRTWSGRDEGVWPRGRLFAQMHKALGLSPSSK